MAHISLQAVRGDEIRVPPHLLWAGEAAGPGFGPVALMPRRIPGGVAASLDGLPAEALPRLRHEGPVAELRRALRGALTERLARPRWLANWLLDDVLDKAALMAGLTGTSALRVWLDVGSGEPCAPFAAADAPLRLVTSYRGPGIAWVTPRLALALPPGAEPAAAALRHLQRGDVAILRGGAGEGVLHRAVAGGDAAPLRLTIEAAGRSAAATSVRRRAPAQPPNIRSSTASQSRST